MADLEERVGRIEALVERLEAAADPAVRDAARELVATLLDYQAEGLARILDVLGEAKHEPLLWRIAREPVVESLLVLHGLHPEETAKRVERALDKARPALRAHHGDVEVISLENDRLRLRLLGTCNGCPASKSTFRNLIATSLEELVPEVASIQVAGLDFEEARAS
jgi:Fe-S cluster biogenesis protein NfuA